MLTKEETARRLALPNGPENLMQDAAQAFDPAWALFLEGNAGACAFLCRCAKGKAYRQAIEARLGPGREALHAALTAPAPKLRKNAARLCGILGREKDAPALMAALSQEGQRFVRPSQILALGSLGGEAARAFLEGYQVEPPRQPGEEAHAKAEAQALQTARRALLRPEKHTFTSLPFPVEVELRCPQGLGQVLAQELRALGYAPAAIHRASLRLHTADLRGLYQARRFFQLLLPLSAGIPLEAGALARRAAGALERILPACHAGAGPFGYRIELKGQALDRGSLARAIASKLDGPLLLNAPGDYEVELRIEAREKGRANLYARLMTLKDDRFAYRLSSLPASMHPATAAAVLGFAGRYLTPHARVLDPCCGSGTFLIERHFLSPCAALTGVDISQQAVEIARANGAAAQCPARFIAKDCLSFTAQAPYDEVIANLPFGNRVGNHKDNLALYAGILDRLPQWLRPGGIAILYTMEYTLLKSLLRERPGLALQAQARTEAGGLLPTIFILQVLSARL